MVSPSRGGGGVARGRELDAPRARGRGDRRAGGSPRHAERGGVGGGQSWRHGGHGAVRGREVDAVCP